MNRRTLIALLAVALLLPACALMDASSEPPEEEVDARPEEQDDAGPDADVEPELNICDGDLPLTFEGEPASFGDACGRCDEGTLQCATDTPNILLCIGDRLVEELNVCGGCAEFPDVALGDLCTTDDDLPGIYTCEEQDVLSCEPLSCDADELGQATFPLAGEHGVDWAITGYVDLVSPQGLPMDYTDLTGPLARIGPDPQTLTVGLPNYNWMDEGVDVTTPFAGLVISGDDGHFDRHIECDDPETQDNHITILLENGFQIRMGQLRRGSLAVSIGDEVQAGDLVGQVGGSGCTDRPALSLKLTACDGEPLSTFALGLWEDPPAYDPPPRVMDFRLVQGTLDQPHHAVDPPFTTRAINRNEPLSLVFHVNNPAGSDTVVDFLFREGGTVISDSSTVDSGPLADIIHILPNAGGGDGFFPTVMNVSIDGEDQHEVALQTNEQRTTGWTLVRADLFEQDLAAFQAFSESPIQPLRFLPVHLNAWTYVAIQMSGTSGEAFYWFDKTLQDHQSQVSLLAEAFANRPVNNVVYETDAGPRYAGIWRADSFQYAFNRYENQLQGSHATSLSTNLSAGRFPQQVSKIFVDDAFRYTAWYADYEPQTFEPEENVPVAGLEAHIDARIVNQSQVPYSITTYRNPMGAQRLLIVWTVAPANVSTNLQFDDELKADELHDLLNTFQSWQTRALTGYINDQGQTRFLLVRY